MTRVDPVTVLARATPEGEAEYQSLVAQLQVKWPELAPISRQPKVSRNLALLGRADYDADTDTYRTCLAYQDRGVPIWILGAYRVRVLTQGTPVFVGRLPLPSWALAVNGLAVGVMGFSAYVIVRALMAPFG